MKATLFNARYGLAMLSLIATVATKAASIGFTYDDAGRLTQADYGGGTRIDYVYDANGNLLQRTTTLGGVTTYTLIYRAGTGGAISGVATQQVAAGGSGTSVQAVPDDASAAFRHWSDGTTVNPRTDANVQASKTVQAAFRSTDGADLDWYAARGLAPVSGETWTDVDARAVPAKGTTLLHENIADTDPNKSEDVFRLTAISNGPPVGVSFTPASAARDYTLQATTNLVTGPWVDVPGQGPRPGAGGADAMSDDAPAPARFYRVKVEVP